MYLYVQISNAIPWILCNSALLIPVVCPKIPLIHVLLNYLNTSGFKRFKSMINFQISKNFFLKHSSTSSGFNTRLKCDGYGDFVLQQTRMIIYIK